MKPLRRNAAFRMARFARLWLEPPNQQPSDFECTVLCSPGARRLCCQGTAVTMDGACLLYLSPEAPLYRPSESLQLYAARVVEVRALRVSRRLHGRGPPGTSLVQRNASMKSTREWPALGVVYVVCATFAIQGCRLAMALMSPSAMQRRDK